MTEENMDIKEILEDKNMDKLDKIFLMQKALNDDIAERRGLDRSDKSEWLQRQTLAMMSEMAELIDEVNFKWWKNPKPLDDEKIKYEIVDILHFFVSMCLTSGMDSKELFDLYLNKNKENFDRQNGLSAKQGYKCDKK